MMNFRLSSVPHRLWLAVLLAALAACDGGTASRNPAPTISALDPEGVMQGHGAFTLTVNGTGFVRGSVVRWNGAARPTTFVSATQLTAAIPAADVEQVGTAQVRVFNPEPGGGQSAPVGLPVQLRGNPVPVITGLSTGAVMVDVGGTVIVTGAGFIPTSRVTVSGMEPAVTLMSPTQLRFTLAPQNVPTAGIAYVRVINPEPGGGGSDSLALYINNPQPTVTALSPAQALRAQDSLVVRLTGTGFVAATVAQVSGSPRTTRRISSTELDMVLTAADLGGTEFELYVTAVNPGPGGGSSVFRILPLVNPVPTVTAVSPGEAQAGQDSLVVRVTGTGFTHTTAVRFEGQARPTRRISSREVEAVLTSADLASTGSFDITAANGAPGGGVSGAVSLTLSLPEPVLTGLPSYGATAGRPGFLLVVHGSGFVRSSVVRWNGEELGTNYISNTRVEAFVSTARVGSPGTASVTVHTPGGGTSAAATMTVRAAGPVSVTSLRELDLPAVDLAWDAARERLYASVTAGTHAGKVVRIDPETGAVEDAVGVGGTPGKMSLSSDGSTLWVAVPGSNQVRRIALPAFTAGAAFSTGFNAPTELHAVPGRAGSVAVVAGGLITVYDDGDARPRQGASTTAAFGESAGVMYGFDNFSSEHGFRTFRVDGEGVTETRMDEDLLSGVYQRILFASGRVYGGGGGVVDAGRPARVGAFAAGINPSAFTVDTRLGRAYFVHSDDGELSVFDINTFQKLGSVYVTSMHSEHPASATERLVRWGSDGLALNDGERIYIIRSPIAGP